MIFPGTGSNKDFPGGSAGKESPAIQETQVQSLGWEDPLQKGVAYLPGEFHVYLPGEFHVYLPGEFHARGAWRAAAHGTANS